MSTESGRRDGGGEQSGLTSSPWFTIWWRPQATITALTRHPARAPTLLLAALAGIGPTIGIGGTGAYFHWIVLVIAAALIGPVLGLLELYIEGALLSWTGGLLGGQASRPSLRTAIAWAALPNVAALPIMVVALAVYHQDFLRVFAGASTDNPVLAVLVLVLAALSLWGLFLRIRTVGAVQHFGILRATANVAASVLIVLAAIFAARSFVFQPFVIPASSMEPALLVGDYVVVDKRSYGYSRYSFPFDARFEGRLGGTLPARGDIVVFKLPRDGETDYIKRVIGLPGDEILMQHGVLHINGTPVPRQRVADVTPQAGAASKQTVAVYEESLPEGRKVTVLDSEPEGPFDNAGPFRIPPGSYFVLGDNRDNSMDSRAMEQVGLIPADNIIGRVSLIYLSADTPRDGNGLASAFANIRWNRLFLRPQ